MPLTNISVKNTKPGEKPIKLFDGGGLFLHIAPSGGKSWRLKYRFGGKEKLLTFGTYPEITLSEAREQRDQARKLLAIDIDPGENKKAQKAALQENSENTFEMIAKEWFGKFAPSWAQNHSEKIIRRLERDIFPWLGRSPISEIKAPELLMVLRRVESRGATETAHRALQNCGQIFRYAIATGRTERDPTIALRGAIPPSKVKHHSSIVEPKAIGELLRAIKGYQGTLITKCALQLAPLVFVRPGELRKAEWSEFNFETLEWRIPAERMKMGELHIVPLSTQAILVLRELQPLTGNGRYVFPGARTNGRPMSENTVNAGLRRLGYTNDQMTGHGFRSMASTLLNEQGWHRDAIERQLAHAERNAVRAAYNYAEHLPERRKMMQAWADYLDKLESNSNLVSIKAA